MSDSRLMVDTSIPQACEKCGKTLRFMGVGTYKCMECGHEMYDDYGKVRNYLDAHVGATVQEVEQATKVPRGKIRQLVRDERLEIAANSAMFLSCDRCGINIRSGRYCEACKKAILLEGEKSIRETKAKMMVGYKAGSTGSSGERRFRRER